MKNPVIAYDMDNLPALLGVANSPEECWFLGAPCTSKADRCRARTSTSPRNHAAACYLAHLTEALPDDRG